MEATGLFCVPNAIPPELRQAHFSRLGKLFSDDLVDAARDNAGYVYRFDADQLEEIALFVKLERHCCPFLDFDLSVPSRSSVAILRVSGPPGTADFLEAEFGHGPAQADL